MNPDIHSRIVFSPTWRSRVGFSIGFTLLLSAFPNTSFARQIDPGYDRSNPMIASRGLVPAVKTHVTNPIELVDLKVMPGIDLAAIQQEDMVRESQGLPFRFAIPNEVLYTPANSGSWEPLDDGTRLWRLRVIAPEAKSINLGFTRYQMPPGGTLFVYATDLSSTIRGFTAADNETHGELWTPPINAEDITIEVTVPAELVDQLDLELGFINHGYRGFFDKNAADAQSGNCNVDVECPEGDPWQNQIPGVAVIAIDGMFTCTGFLVNNTSLDRTPYFMTANHCGLNASNDASLITFWNYENSTCRTPGGVASGLPGDGLLEWFNSGSIHKAGYAPSDFTLVELDDNPDPAYEVTFLGWDRTTAIPTSTATIHHPQVEEKRISFDDDPPIISSFPLGTTCPLFAPSPGDGTQLRVIDWDLGTTENGSSGSPLFDQNQRVVGQLGGGCAACGNSFSDWFGRFSSSWTGGGTNITRLSNWLDPISTGAMTIDYLGPLVDCDYNGLHDPEEIAATPSLDCQPNGILDSCELGSHVNENFDNFGALGLKGWLVQNSSNPIGDFSYAPGTTTVFTSHSGSGNSYTSVNFLSIEGIRNPQDTAWTCCTGTISNWLFTPEVDLIDGRTFSFWTRTLTGNIFPDRLELRLSTNGASTDVGGTESSWGDFSTVLVSVNPSLLSSTYPEVWTQYSATLSGIGSPTTGRFAFRYFVTDGGPTGANSNFIGIDDVEYFSDSNDLDEDGIPDDCASLPCLSDINNDGEVGVTDLIGLLAAWGDCPLPCTLGVINSPQDTCPEDRDRNCVVDVQDLIPLLADWGLCP